MHIPKCAGSSVHASLESALPAGSLALKRADATIFCGFTDPSVIDASIHPLLVLDGDDVCSLRDRSVVSGHFSLSTLLQVTDPSGIATVLREPRTRVLSHWAYWRCSAMVRRLLQRFPPVRHAQRPLAEFLSEPSVAPVTDNLICRMILGDHALIPNVGFIANRDLEAVAAATIAQLKRFGSVGIVELAEQMWSALSGFFGVELSPVMVNVTADDIALDSPPIDLKLTDDLLDLLDARTGADAIVYRQAVERSGDPGVTTSELCDSAFAREVVRLTDLRTGPVKLAPMAPEILAGDALSQTMRELATGASGSLKELWRDRAGQHTDDTYAGIPMWKFPEDLRTYEQILWERQPRIVIEVGVQDGGSTLWLRDRLFDFQRYRTGPAPRVIGVDVNLDRAHESFRDLPTEGTAGIELIEGRIEDAGVVEQVFSAVPRGAEVFVIEDAAHDAGTTLAALRSLAPLIRAGGYYMVEDTCVDYEPLRITHDWPRGCATALAEWLAQDPLGRRFRRRPDLQAYGLTCHPGGLLQRLTDL